VICLPFRFNVKTLCIPANLSSRLRAQTTASRSRACVSACQRAHSARLHHRLPSFPPRRLGSGAGLAPADWRAVFKALGRGLERLDEVGYRALPAGLVQGSLAELDLGAGPYGYRPFGADDAAVLGALLPRSGSVLTRLDFS
jgi:hypothetical protein